MTDLSKVTKLSLLLEKKLVEHGVVLHEGHLGDQALPAFIADRLDGLIENIAELEGLLRISHAIRRGEALSPPVANAAQVMIQEVFEALYTPNDFRNVPRLH